MAFAQHKRVEIKNWIPTIEEQTHMMDRYGFAVQERIEVQYTSQGKPLYRYSLCQYRKQNDELLFFNDSSNHDPSRTYNKNQQNPMLRYTYKDVERLYSYGECANNGLCDDDMAFINWIKEHDLMDGNWFNESWLQDNSVFVKDQALQLNCFYYLNDKSDHMQDYFVLMHSSMDDLFACIEYDAWFKGTSLTITALMLAARFPAMVKYMRSFLPRLSLPSVVGNSTAANALASYAPVFQAIESALTAGRLNPLAYQKVRSILTTVMTLITSGIAIDQGDQILEQKYDWYREWKQDYYQGWVDYTADKLLDFVIGPPRHFGGLSQATETILADDSVYTEMNGFQRIDGRSNGVDYSRIGQWDEEKDHSLIEFVAFKRRILGGACALNKFLDSDPGDMGGFNMHHHVHKIRRSYAQGNAIDYKNHYLELYYGYFRDALDYAGLKPKWNDTWNDKSMLIIP